MVLSVKASKKGDTEKIVENINKIGKKAPKYETKKPKINIKY